MAANSTLPDALKVRHWIPRRAGIWERRCWCPILEELFWRGWLMRWLIITDFARCRWARTRPYAFWVTALLFASEHGSYWDVGLLTGIIYNWWLIRTRNLANCILAHAVTNGCLAAYVLGWGQWQYWL